MPPISEQPWLLLTIAAAFVPVIWILNIFLKSENKKFLYLLPVVIAGSAFAFDHFIRTDKEIITENIEKLTKAAEKQDIDKIAEFISEDYKDSIHRSKKRLMDNCYGYLRQPLIKKAVTSITQMNIQKREAELELFIRVVFSPESDIARNYMSQMFFTFRVYMHKKNPNSWLIERAELKEVNNQQADWRKIF